MTDVRATPPYAGGKPRKARERAPTPLSDHAGPDAREARTHRPRRLATG
ncbi:hypothetical protein [Streptomyces bikiniensis]|nr:hypothetical protein [Streptomyces bikiniensis]